MDASAYNGGSGHNGSGRTTADYPSPASRTSHVLPTMVSQISVKHLANSLGSLYAEAKDLLKYKQLNFGEKLTVVDSNFVDQQHLAVENSAMSDWSYKEEGVSSYIEGPCKDEHWQEQLRPQENHVGQEQVYYQQQTQYRQDHLQQHQHQQQQHQQPPPPLPPETLPQQYQPSPYVPLYTHIQNNCMPLPLPDLSVITHIQEQTEPQNLKHPKQQQHPLSQEQLLTLQHQEHQPQQHQPQEQQTQDQEPEQQQIQYQQQNEYSELPQGENEPIVSIQLSQCPECTCKPSLNDDDTENDKSLNNSACECTCHKIKLENQDGGGENGGDSELNCKRCAFTTNNKSSYARHIRTRHNKNVCVPCGIRFAKKIILMQHIKDHHGADELFICPQPKCDFSCNATSKRIIRRHRMRHAKKAGVKFYSYHCTGCDYKTNIKDRFMSHVTKHTGEKIFKCEYCAETFTTVYKRDKHLMFHTGDFKFRCEWSGCDKAFPTPYQKAKHMELHTGKRAWPCTLCPKSFTMKGQLEAHMFSHTGEKKFDCPQCDYKAATDTAIKRHLITHTDAKPHFCFQCGANFKRRDKMLKHIKKQHQNTGHQVVQPPGNYQYILEQQQLQQERLTAQHQQFLQQLRDTRKSQKVAKLEQEGEQNPEYQEYKEYQEYHEDFDDLIEPVRRRGAKKKTPKSSGKFHCSKCDFKCPVLRKRIIKTHRRKHSAQDGKKYFSYSCNLCDYTSPTKAKFDSHMRKHTGEKIFKCELCSEKFMTKYKLDRHMSEHTGEYKYTCNECDAKFPTPYGKIKHMESHTGKKAHPCTQCSSSFTTKGQLQAHMLTHGAEKIYECQQCDYKGATEIALKRHMIKHTDAKPHTCQICNSSYKRKHKLQEHIKKFHTQAPESLAVSESPDPQVDPSQEYYNTPPPPIVESLFPPQKQPNVPNIYNHPVSNISRVSNVYPPSNQKQPSTLTLLNDGVNPCSFYSLLTNY